jgi:hypothetical protein
LTGERLSFYRRGRMRVKFQGRGIPLSLILSRKGRGEERTKLGERGKMESSPSLVLSFSLFFFPSPFIFHPFSLDGRRVE